MRIMLGGGGSGGHVYPMLAVLRQLPAAARGCLWVGSERIESRLVPAAGIDFRKIDIRFSWRRPTPRNWDYYRRHILPLVAGRPFRQALRLLDEYQPQLVMGCGGYVSAPVLWAAQQRGVPTALLEINSPPGLVNWWYAPHSARIYAATEKIAQGFSGRTALGKLLVSGYPSLAPQRTAQAVRDELALPPQRRLLVVAGGSLGARAVLRAACSLAASPALQTDEKLRNLSILLVAGTAAADFDPAAELERSGVRVRASGAQPAASGPDVLTAEYLHDMPGTYAAADFYLGRSGAATVGELLESGIQALLVPDPQHADRQQFGNAEALTQRGQGRIIRQADLTGAAVADWLRSVWDLPRLPAPPVNAAQLIAADLWQRFAGGAA